MRVTTYLLWGIAGIFLLGCETRHYRLEMEPDDSEVKRTITAWQVDNDVKEQIAPEELSRIAALYPERLSDPSEAVQAFSGKFGTELPNDVGGAGTYLHYESDLGDAWMYVERFRGNDAPAEEIASELNKADRLADQLLGWLTEELGSEPEFDNLRAFIDGPLRVDLRNLATYAWMGRQLDTRSEMYVRSFQYLVERGYLSYEELPRYMRLFTEASEQERPKAFLEFLQRQAAARMGIPPDQPIPASLGFLGNPDTAEASLVAYLKKTPEYRAKMAEWKVQKQEDPTTEPPTPLDALISPDFMSLGMLLASRDNLEVSMATAQEPDQTNGTWDPEAGRTQWHAVLQNGSLPAMCYAMWTRPATAFQEEHFGKVAFEGDDLAAYCVWRHSLTEQQAHEWDDFVGSLRPEPATLKKLETFRFSSDPKPTSAPNTDPQTNYAAWPLGKLQRALKDETK